MNNAVSVMVEDNWIAVDDEVVWFESKIKLLAAHKRLWALHWKNGKGECQLDDPPENIFFDKTKYNEYVKPYVDQWTAEKRRQKAKIEAELNSPENIEAAAREKRNYLLEKTDYLLMPDYPLSEEERAAWTAYRQALRELPDQKGWPTNISWPAKPNI